MQRKFLSTVDALLRKKGYVLIIGKYLRGIHARRDIL